MIRTIFPEDTKISDAQDVKLKLWIPPLEMHSFPFQNILIWFKGKLKIISETKTIDIE